MTCKGMLRLTYCNCSRVEKCCYKLILEFLSMIMVYLHCFCTQCMPKAPQISGELHSWYSRNKPLYEDRLSVTQHNKTMVSMWAQLLKAAISKSDQPACGNSLCTRNISPAQIFCIPFFQCSPVGGDIAENWRIYGILGHLLVAVGNGSILEQLWDCSKCVGGAIFPMLQAMSLNRFSRKSCPNL